MRLGDVPTHWDVRRLRHVCRFAYGDSLGPEHRDIGEVSVFGSNGQFGVHTTANTLQPVIVVGRKGSYGKVNFSESSVFATDTTYFVDSRYSDAHLRWLFYALGTLELDMFSKDSAVPGLSRNEAYACYIAVPTFDEQQKIAAFLDYVTTRIDMLVKKCHSFVDRLKEWRSALVSNAITCGASANAVSRPSWSVGSAIEPYGAIRLRGIPQSWRVVRLKYVASINDEILPESTDPNLDISYVDIGSVDRDQGIVSSDRIAFGNAPSRARRIVRHGDIIVSTVRTYLRAIASITDQNSNAIVSTGFAVVRPHRVSPDFLAYALSECGFVEEIMARSVGVSYPAINPSELGSMLVPLPSESEQNDIVMFLDRRTFQISATISKVQTMVERLREYRSALVVAAVTGAIDVRRVEPAIVMAGFWDLRHTEVRSEAAAADATSSEPSRIGHRSSQRGSESVET